MKVVAIGGDSAGAGLRRLQRRLSSRWAARAGRAAAAGERRGSSATLAARAPRTARQTCDRVASVLCEVLLRVRVVS